MSGAKASASVQLKSDRLLGEKTRGRKRRKGREGGGGLAEVVEGNRKLIDKTCSRDENRPD